MHTQYTRTRSSDNNPMFSEEFFSFSKKKATASTFLVKSVPHRKLSVRVLENRKISSNSIIYMHNKIPPEGRTAKGYR